MDLRALFDTAGQHLAAWISAGREAHRPHAAPLDEATRTHLAAYFAPQLLDGVRVREVEAIEQPEQLVALVRGAGLDLALAPISGLTLIDTILVVRRDGGPSLRLLFHELVHVVHYRELGVEGFARAYVNGWAEGGGAYEGIPLEAQALALEERFATDPRAFEVAMLVREQVSPGPALDALSDA